MLSGVLPLKDLMEFQTNNRQVEPQIMQKFQSIPLPQEYESFLQLLASTQKGSLSSATCSGESVSNLMGLSSSQPPSFLDFSLSKEESLIPPLSEKVMSSGHYKQICKVYSQLYPHLNIKFVPRSYVYSRRATLSGELLVAASFNKKHSVIASFWPGYGDSE